MDSGGFAALGVCFGLFLLLRLARSGVFVHRDGLRVLNPISSRFIPWGDVRTFRLDVWGVFPRMGFVELTDGSHITFGASKRLIQHSAREADRRID